MIAQCAIWRHFSDMFSTVLLIYKTNKKIRRIVSLCDVLLHVLDIHFNAWSGSEIFCAYRTYIPLNASKIRFAYLAAVVTGSKNQMRQIFYCAINERDWCRNKWFFVLTPVVTPSWLNRAINIISIILILIIHTKNILSFLINHSVWIL